MVVANRTHIGLSGAASDQISGEAFLAPLALALFPVLSAHDALVPSAFDAYLNPFLVVNEGFALAALTLLV